MSAPASPSRDLDPTIVQSVVAAHEADILRCYENEACPRLLPYSMHACFTIEANGSVAAPDADSVNAKIRSCVVDV